VKLLAGLFPAFVSEMILSQKRRLGSIAPGVTPEKHHPAPRNSRAAVYET
jgi:hypothetical protein